MKRIPLFWISSAFLLGIAFASILSFEKDQWKRLFIISAICLFIEWLLRKRWSKSRIFILPIFFLLLMFTGGGWRYVTVRNPDITNQQLAYYNNREKVEIIGHICADPQRTDTSFRLVVCTTQINEPVQQDIHGKVMVFLKAGDWFYGDKLKLYGEVVTPFENEEFSYKEYLSQRGISSVMSFPWVEWIEHEKGFSLMRSLFSIRRAAYEKIQHFYPQPEASLLSGILLGIETDIPADLKNAFQNTGTDHIIAISGFNMTILAGIFLKGFRKWLSIWWAALFAILAIGFYTILVGAAPAVVRAAIMSSLAISASLIGRGQSGKYTLMLTAAVMCLINPLLLWNAGFQLSVMATLGLVLYAGRLSNWFNNLAKKLVSEEKAEKITNLISEYILFTLAAQLTVMPIILYHFERVSIISLIANPLILPVQPLTMVLGGIAVITGLLIPPLGQLLSYVVWVLLFYTNQVVSWLSEISRGALVLGEMTFISVLVLYAVIFFFTYKSQKEYLQRLKKPTFLLAGIITAIFFVWNAVFLKPDQNLHLWILDEGNQGAVFVQTPSGKRILINTGELANPLSSELGKHIPAINREIDLVIATTSKEKNYQAFPKILERFSIDQFIWAESVPITRSAKEINATLKENQTDILLLKNGELIDFGDGVFLEKWDSQSTGISMVINYQEFRFVYLEDVQKGLEESQIIDGAVVLLPQSGKKRFNSIEMVPQIIIHHDMEVNQDIPGELSTDNEGKIEIVTNGTEIWLKGEK